MSALDLTFTQIFVFQFILGALALALILYTSTLTELAFGKKVINFFLAGACIWAFSDGFSEAFREVEKNFPNSSVRFFISTFEVKQSEKIFHSEYLTIEKLETIKTINCKSMTVRVCLSMI